jgi:hypothetical protein
MEIKTKEQDIGNLGIVEGKIKAKESPTEEDFAEVIKAPEEPKEKPKKE